jgi:hypothetical protein
MRKGDPDLEKWAYAGFEHIRDRRALNRLMDLLGDMVDRIGRGR